MRNTDKTTMTSGGRRPGAGKPSLAPGLRRKNMTLRLAPETVRRLALIRAAGFQTSRVVDDLVEAFCRHAGLETDSAPDAVAEPGKSS